jgi:diguanylate cyclase (GGDEF)-like protein/PAS domain S-box-containing protein
VRVLRPGSRGERWLGHTRRGPFPRRKDGSLFRATGIFTALRNQQDGLRGINQVTRDLKSRQKTETMFEGTLEAALDAMIGVDQMGVIRFVNRQTESFFGYDRDDLLGQPVETLITESFRQAHPAHRAVDVATPETRALGSGLALMGRRKDGTEFPVTVTLSSLETEDGPLVIAAVRDLSECQAADQVVRKSEERFQRVFDNALIGKSLVNTHGAIVRVNATLAHLLDCEPQSLIGEPLVSSFGDEADKLRILKLIGAGAGGLRAEMALCESRGRPLWGLVDLSWMHEHDGEKVLLAQIEDITARRVAEHRLSELSLHDELTGLPNRRLLMQRCEAAFARARASRSGTSSIAALSIGLDGFKPINDTAGHDTGDQVLIAIARDLPVALGPTETVARVGGDEFVVLLEYDDRLAYLRTVADRITAIIRRQVTAGAESLALSASVGIARVDLASEPDVSPEQLLRRADAAMHRAKERGGDQHDVFDTDLRDRTEARQALVHAIRDGLRDDRVALVFQPVVDVDRGLVVGAEALMRLRNEGGIRLPTLPVIIAAEAAGLAEAVGDRVLHLALGEARTWPVPMTLAVNISARELTGHDLRGRVERALIRHDFDPARLILEITESSIVRAGPVALAELEMLRQLGVKVAIDDFGTAYATLQNLTVLPVDVLKVDSTFTAGLACQRTHTAIVHGIASMAHELGIPCIIEGVETGVQLEAIQGMSVYAQGWYWGKPRGAGHVPILNPVPDPDDPE